MRAALALVPLTLVLGACGRNSGSSAADPVAEAASTTADEGSAHVKFTARSTAGGLTVDILGSGAVQRRTVVGYRNRD